MRICRYNENRLGLVENDTVYDVSSVLEQLPTLTWPVAPITICSTASIPHLTNNVSLTLKDR